MESTDRNGMNGCGVKTEVSTGCGTGVDSSGVEVVSDLWGENRRLRTLIVTLEAIKDRLIVVIDECDCIDSTSRAEIFELISDYNQMKASDHNHHSIPSAPTTPAVTQTPVKAIAHKRQYRRRCKARPLIASSGGTKRRGRPKKSTKICSLETNANNSDKTDGQLSIESFWTQELSDKRSTKRIRGHKVGHKYLTSSSVKVYKSVTIGNQVFACLRSIDDRLFHCEWPDCGRSFGQKGNIIRHYAVHGAEKEYKCSWPDCTREFADSSTLKRHLLVHSGQKPFDCDWPSCGYKCNSHSGLKVHKRRHTGEKPYKCDWPGCCAAFTSASNLIEHRRTHTGEKPYKCDWPGCAFESSGSSDLKKHRRIHTGEKPYKCEWPGCTSRTGTSSEMKQHRRTHTGERPYKCDFPGCGFNASHATVIRKHKRSRHKI